MQANLLYLLPALTGAVLLSGCVPVQQLQTVAAAGGALANSMTNSIAGAGEPVALSAGELRQLQTRDFATTKGAAFASAMTVLLDSGYRVQSADLESGLITATASSTARLRLDTTGLSRANQTPVASVYVEERGGGTARVRIVFSLGTSATGPLAAGGERAVLDRTVYEAFFSGLADEIELRPLPVPPLQTPPTATSPEPAPAIEPAPSPETAPVLPSVSVPLEEPAARDPELTLDPEPRDESAPVKADDLVEVAEEPNPIPDE